MKKPLLALFAALALVAGALGFMPTTTPAATNGTTQYFTITAAGQSSPIIPLNGYSSCAILLDNAGTGLSGTAQATNDANPSNTSQWFTATTIGSSGVITAFGNNVGNVAGVGLTGFRFLVTALTTGPVTGSISCSTATAGGGAVAISSLPPITISPLPLPVTCVSGGCPTPIPFPTLAVNVQNFPSPGPTDSAGRPIVNFWGTHRYAITAASATGCNSLQATPGALLKVINTGPQMTVFLQFYDDNGSCAAADLLAGDGTTIVWGPLQGITFNDLLTTGLSYKLSSALTSLVTVSTF